MKYHNLKSRIKNQNCSREVISQFFGVSTYIVERSRKVFEKNGILGEVDLKMVRILKYTKYLYIIQIFPHSEKFSTRGNQMYWIVSSG